MSRAGNIYASFRSFIPAPGVLRPASAVYTTSTQCISPSLKYCHSPACLPATKFHSEFYWCVSPWFRREMQEHPGDIFCQNSEEKYEFGADNSSGRNQDMCVIVWCDAPCKWDWYKKRFRDFKKLMKLMDKGCRKLQTHNYSSRITFLFFNPHSYVYLFAE